MMNVLGLLLAGLLVLPALARSSGAVSVADRKLYVDGHRFTVKGVVYSPVPIGASAAWTPPYGNYFGSAAYKKLWHRDFPRIKAMGANAIRIYTISADADHKPFLDTAHQYGLKVLATYYLGTATTNPVASPGMRANATEGFLKVVEKYASHPAILGFVYGNELNGIWNGFLQQLSDDPAHSCSWGGQCYYVKGGDCEAPRRCVYNAFFDWVNGAARKAHRLMERMGVPKKLVTTALADVDFAADMATMFEWKLDALDFWAFHAYRGRDFGQGKDDLLSAFGMREFGKMPLVVAEYGVDAYKDACGFCISKEQCPSPCFNTVNDPPEGFGEDQKSQEDWDGHLTQLIIDHWDNGTVGSFIMSWQDEYWKGTFAVSGCKYQIGSSRFDDKLCDWKAHADCPSKKATEHSICGYWLAATPDMYVNEGWYGINAVEKNPKGGPDRIIPRRIYYKLQQLFEGREEPDYTQITLTHRYYIAGLILFGTVLFLMLIRELKRRGSKWNRSTNRDTSHRPLLHSSA